MPKIDPNQWPPEHGMPKKSRFKKGRDLEWGETPFDTLSRGELLRLVQGYHMALTAADGVMNQFSFQQEAHPFWGPEGMGGRTQAKIDALFDLCGQNGSDQTREGIYRNFFRTALCLLFPKLIRKYDDWGVDDKGVWCSPNPGPEQGYRPVEWKDLLPIEDKQ